MKFTKITLFISMLFACSHVGAAIPVDLRHTSPQRLSSYLTGLQQPANFQGVQFKILHHETDAHHIRHTRFQQTYHGLPVWGAYGVRHQRQATGLTLSSGIEMNGKLYEGLDEDLHATAGIAANDAGPARALSRAKLLFEQDNGVIKSDYQQETVTKVVFVDSKQQAHYAYHVSFYIDDGVSGARRLNTIMDAVSLSVYHTWDSVKTDADKPKETPLTAAGGIGGNLKTGPVVYDGAAGHMPALMMEVITSLQSQQADAKSACVLQTHRIVVVDAAFDNETVSNDCVLDASHAVFWLDQDENGTRWKKDEINSGYSPSLDAFYAADIVNKLYQEWYGIPALVKKDGKTPMKLVMRVHYGRYYDNAFWNGEVMTFGDGGELFYPLTSLDVTAHEISHGFTSQHAGIDGWELQMAGLHESFSDMAAAAAEYYTTGKNTWKIGATITKGNGAIRYMDAPTKDNRSIDHMRDYREAIGDGHLVAGVTNKAFYLLATTPGWNTHKAFDVMVQANRFYWTPGMTTYAEAACGVRSAARDLGYPVDDVQAAFAQVGLDTSSC